MKSKGILFYGSKIVLNFQFGQVRYILSDNLNDFAANHEQFKAQQFFSM